MCREAISARLDGHDTDDPRVDSHLAACNECQAWRADAVALAHRVDLHTAQPVPDRSASILAALAEASAADEVAARAEALLPWRVGLAVLGAVQLLLAAPVVLFGSEPSAGIHVSRELGSFDVALAVGFLVAAWRPARAWGMVPVVAALALCLVLTSAVDISEGRATLAGESYHLTHVVGLVMLWALAHAHRRPVRLRSLAAL